MTESASGHPPVVPDPEQGCDACGEPMTNHDADGQWCDKHGKPSAASEHRYDLRADLADKPIAEIIDRAVKFQELWIAAEDRWREGVTQWTAEINRLRDLIKPDADDVARMEEALRLHYGERVAPVSSYCEAFFDWQKAMAENGVMPDVVEALASLYLPVMKSNYLARRIYGGEPHRTEKCPVHEGRWSGCYPPDEPDGACECVTGGNTTGWLPAKEEA